MMFKFYWYGILACLILFGQACSFTQKVKTGMQAYEVKQYAVATQLFDGEYHASRNPKDKAQIAFFTGKSFSILGDPASASAWFYKAYKEGYGEEALLRYAEMLKQQEKYEEAILAYEDLQKSAPGNAGYRANITLCRQAIEWKKNTNPDCQVQTVSFNSSASDYSPQPIGPGIILFTSDRESRQNADKYLWTGRAFSDLYVSNSVTRQVTDFGSRINSPENEGTAVISPDGKVLVFTRCFVDQSYDAWCKLMISFRRGKDWSEPETLPFTRDKVNYGHPAFAANGGTLFFSSDAPEGQGGHDIYYTQPDGQGSWSEPVNLGYPLNTAGEEVYPTVYKDTLYYSSDHLAGLGGLDIFKTYLDARGQWASPLNLRSPINSGGDDFGFVVDTFALPRENVMMEGYFASSRAGVTHQDDIYAFAVLGKPSDVENIPDTTKDDVVAAKKIDYQVFLSLRVMEPLFEIKDDPNSKRVGKRPLPNGPIVLSQGLTDQRFVTDDLGQFLIKLEWDKEYTFTARYRDHLAATYTINTGELEKNEKNPITTINQILELDPIFKDTEIELENIFYDYDQWAIREDAKPSLNHLSIILKTNPAIRIQLSSHTDCRGTDEYNLELSQKRAQAAIEYLMSLGIPARRLEALGLGESNLAIKCVCESCSEEEHQTNRRTTFKIID